MNNVMADFQKAFAETLKIEGGYSNHKADKGGETYKGISRVHWPDWPGWDIIDEIKENVERGSWEGNMNRDNRLEAYVASFYQYNFWDKQKCNQMPQEIADELFDTSVNMGTAYGAECLQKALNKLNRNQRDYPDIVVDGGIGPVTIGTLREYLKTSRFNTRNREKLVKWLLRWMNYYQLQRYDNITNANLEQEVFVPGWTERV